MSGPYEAGDLEGQVWMCARDVRGHLRERPLPPERVERYLARLEPGRAEAVRRRLTAEGIDVAQGVLPSRLFEGEKMTTISPEVMKRLRVETDDRNGGVHTKIGR